MERASIKVLGVKFRADRSSVGVVMTGSLFQTLPWMSTKTSISSTVGISRSPIGGARTETTTVLGVKFQADPSSVQAVMAGTPKQTNRQTDKQTNAPCLVYRTRVFSPQAIEFGL